MLNKRTCLISFLILLVPSMIIAQMNSSKVTKTLNQQQNLRSIISYQGMITIPSDVFSKMQQEWHMPANAIPGNPVKVQLWNVVYKSDPKKNGFTEILLQQQISPINLSYQLVSGSITYKLDAQVSGGNLAIVIFNNKLNSASGLAIKGRPEDGSVQGMMHHYESDTKTKLGQNIVYGIYSIVSGKTDMNRLDFTYASPSTSHGQKTMGFDLGGFVDDIAGDVEKFTKQVINGVEYVFDQTIDGVSGLAKFAAKGVEDAADFFIDQTGTIFYSIGGTLINFIAFGNLPSERTLKQEEYDWANKMIFNGNLPDISRIKVFNFMNPDHHRFYTWPSPTGDLIYMNIGDAFNDPMNYVDHINNAYLVKGQVFIHELSHAWQINKYGSAQMISKYFSASGGLNQNYNPDCAHNNINSNFNIEQQATLVDRTFMQLYYGKTDGSSCTAFEQQWVENNVRKGEKFDLAKIQAAIAMHDHAQPFLSFIGNVDNADANYSKGNGRDGDGYYMLGSIPWSVLYYVNKDKKAYANWGEIRKKYNGVNAEHGYLGWPVVDINSLPNGCSRQQFLHGYIYNNPKYGTFIVDGFILEAWGNKNWEKGELGYPISDFIPDNTSGNNSNKLLQQTSRGGYQKFEHGIIKWSGVPGMQAEVVLNNSLLNDKNFKVRH